MIQQLPLPVVLPLDTLIAEDVTVVTPGGVGDVYRGTLEEPGGKGSAYTQRTGAREGLDDCDTALWWLGHVDGT